MDRDYLAKESEFLSNHEVLNFILDEMRKEAVEALVTAPNDQYHAIAECQARVQAVDHIRSLFRFHMNQAKAAKAPGPVV